MAEQPQEQMNADLRQRLIREAGSHVNDVALMALSELEKLGWLADKNGVLKGTDLRTANWQGVYLDEVNLRGANLNGANLQKADLLNADLRQADLGNANLQGAEIGDSHMVGANLVKANLQGARLGQVNLYGATLCEADLRGTCLDDVNLESADLQGTLFDETTILPDAKWIWDQESQTPHYPPEAYWTPETNMTKYTDPNHPQFWRWSWAGIIPNTIDD